MIQMLSTSHLPTTSRPLVPSPYWDLVKENVSLKCVLLILYAVFCVLGVCGNCLVIFVVIRRRSMQTITNMFIANLALSDALMSSVATPITPLVTFSENWFLPEVLCKLLPMVMGVSVYVSTLTSTAIALDRYFIIVHPFVERMRRHLCLCVIFVVWLVSIFISLPLAVYQKKKQQHLPADLDTVRMVYFNGSTPYVCEEGWPRSSAREVFSMVSFCLQFIIPCAIISYCYWAVSGVLRRRCRAQVANSGFYTEHRRQREEAELKRTCRTNKMLIAMIVIFALCWTPLNILWIINDINSSQILQQRQLEEEDHVAETFTPQPELQQGRISAELQHRPYFTLLFCVCHIIAMSSAIYNPLLYAGMNENFLTEFRTVLPCVFRSCLFPSGDRGHVTTVISRTVGQDDTVIRRCTNVPVDSEQTQPLQLDVLPLNTIHHQ